MVDRGIRCIYVLRLFICQNTPAERDHVAAQVNDRKHDACVEAIHRAAGARLHRDVCRNHLALGIALGAQVIDERKAAFRRPAEPEMADHFHGQASAREIIKPRLALRA